MGQTKGIISGAQAFNPRSWSPELSCPAEHATFACIWARKVVPGARSLAYDITQSTNEARHLSFEVQESIAKAGLLAEMLHIELMNIQHNVDSEVSGQSTPAAFGGKPEEDWHEDHSPEHGASAVCPSCGSSDVDCEDGEHWCTSVWACQDCEHQSEEW